MTDHDRSLVEAARRYCLRGYAVVPVPAGRKGAVLTGWTRMRLKEGELHEHFSGGGNIGILLGEPSGWLVDVDLDCDEAVALAPDMLPYTPVISGRGGRPKSHWWYIAQGAETRQHRDPVTSDMIVEYRSTGAQTLVGPSVHPDGELYDPLEGEPAVVDAEQLGRAVTALAEAVRKARGHEDRPRVPAVPVDRGAGTTDAAVVRRAGAYLDHIPPAVSGRGGHNQTYAAATAMVHGFGLDPEAAFWLLWDRYNPRCEPPWSEGELRHKVKDAAEKPHERPYGWLRDRPRSAAVSVFSEPSPQMACERADDGAGGDQGGGVGPAEADPGGLDPGAFPERLLAVPGLIGEVMRYNLSTATRQQPVLALAGAICLQAVLSARKVRDERGNRTNLYCIGVAPSGAGKDHARKVNKNILFAAGLEEHDGNEDLASDAGLVSVVEQRPGVLFQIDEIGRFLRTIGDAKKAPHLFNIVTTLMKLYSCADTVYKGKAYADPARNKTVVQPCVSVYGTTVPDNFYESLTTTSFSDGFIARLLVFEAEATSARCRAKSASVPESIVTAARWWGAFRNTHGPAPDPLVVETTAEANVVFDGLNALVDAEMAPSDREGVVGSSLWARAEEKACRLALVYACSKNCEHPVIDEEAARWACDLSAYLTRRTLFVAQEWVADGVFDALQKRVVRVIRSAGGLISRTDLCRKTQWLTQRDRREIIANMIETGRLRELNQKTSTRPGVWYELV